MSLKQSKFKYDLIAEEIMAQIAAGRWNPGDKMPSEADLTAMYNVSRVTLRESLKKLNMMGLLTITQGDGTYVNEIKPSGFMKPLFPLLAFKKSNIKEIYEARMYIEGGACELAAQRRTEEDALNLRELVENMEEAIQANNHEMYNEYDKEFHAAAVRACKNETLITIYQLFQDFVEGYIDRININALIVATSLMEHQQICQAICDQSPELARIAMHEHLKKAQDILMGRMQ